MTVSIQFIDEELTYVRTSLQDIQDRWISHRFASRFEDVDRRLSDSIEDANNALYWNHLIVYRNKTASVGRAEAVRRLNRSKLALFSLDADIGKTLDELTATARELSLYREPLYISTSSELLVCRTKIKAILNETVTV